MAYIVFASKDSVDRALSLSGTSLFSRQLTVCRNYILFSWVSLSRVLNFFGSCYLSPWRMIIAFTLEEQIETNSQNVETWILMLQSSNFPASQPSVWLVSLVWSICAIYEFMEFVRSAEAALHGTCSNTPELRSNTWREIYSWLSLFRRRYDYRHED